MVRTQIAFYLSLIVVTLTGCASIVGSNKTVAVNNKFGPTFFAIKDRQQKIVHQGMTPQQVTLSTRDGLIKPAKYQVDFMATDDKTDSCELHAGVNPWIAGNALFGLV